MPERVAEPKVKHDPKFFTAARELRDRCLEQINTTPMLGRGKYDLSRALKAAPLKVQVTPTHPKQLSEAA